MHSHSVSAVQHYVDGRQNLEIAHKCIQKQCSPSGTDAGAKQVDDQDEL
jgi:hypothetical protein